MTDLHRTQTRTSGWTLAFLTICLSCRAEERPAVVLADFDGPDYNGWEVTGEAFGKTPSAPSPHVVGYLGKSLADTRTGTTNHATGVLTSPPFEVSRNNVTFLIGGSKVPGVACIYFVVDGKVVRHAVGDQRWICLDRAKDLWACVMKRQGWDVREFAGEQAQIRIVDKAPNSYVMVDQIELTDEPLQAELRLAKIFTDSMVLQQGKPARIWGWARPGSEVAVSITEDESAAKLYLSEETETPTEEYEVTVTYTERNAPAFTAQTKTATADEAGRWQTELAPMTAGFTQKYVVVKSGEQGVAIKNVLIGEIWVCAGQSNMGWGGFHRKDREAASADFPGLRYIAWNDSWHKPLDDIRNAVRWQVCSPKAAQRFSAVPYLYGMFLHRYLKVPVGIINVARGGTLGQTWCLREELDDIDSVILKTVLKDYDAETATWEDMVQVEERMTKWKESCDQLRAEHAKKVAEAKAAGKKEPKLRDPRLPGDPRNGWSPPAGLFNATVMPIRHLSLRGVLYYQGENQAFRRWTRYEHTFPRIPGSFRKAFGEKELPFGCIGQAGWGKFEADPELETARGGYQIVRDIQQRALKDDPNAGYIAIYPTGNSNIHPPDKFPVAEYASLWALAKVYKKPVVHRGPVFREMVKDGSRMFLFFDPDPLVQQQWVKPDKTPPWWAVLPMPREGSSELKGFIIAGEDRRWCPAKARNAKRDGKWALEVHSPLVKDPVAVRYGWACWPTGNLVGASCLPMPTFRTDNWPLPVGVNYSKEAQKEADEELRRLKEQAERQALDRKIRQMQSDLPALELQLHVHKNKNWKQLAESRIARMEAILAALEKDNSRYPELKEEVKAAREVVKRLKARAESIGQEE